MKLEEIGMVLCPRCMLVANWREEEAGIRRQCPRCGYEWVEPYEEKEEGER